MGKWEWAHFYYGEPGLWLRNSNNSLQYTVLHAMQEKRLHYVEKIKQYKKSMREYVRQLRTSSTKYRRKSLNEKLCISLNRFRMMGRLCCNY